MNPTKLSRSSYAAAFILSQVLTLAPPLARADAPEPSRGRPMIVELREGVDPSEVARRCRVTPTHVYQHALNGFSTQAQDMGINLLMADRDVLRVEPDEFVSVPDPDLANTEAALSWGLDRIDQRLLPLDGQYNPISNGAGVSAYIIDTGIYYAHSDFGGRAKFGFDYSGKDGADCNGHGTHVSGTLGGLHYGVAKGVDLYAVKVLDCRGSGTWSSVLAGIDWVTGNRKLPAVANLSLGGNRSTIVDLAVTRMINSGVATAIAAGNSNQDACKSSPARVGPAMTIASAGKTDARSSWSNWGNCVDWFAPGESITSAYITSPTSTAIYSGTSMSAPHTAGVAALYLQNHPSSSATQVRDALYSFATKGRISNSRSTNNHLLYSFETTNP